MYKPHIVILGAGYSGLMAATRLQKIIHRNEADITLVNNNDYHYQTTWLHEAAAGSLHPERTAIPVRDIINQEKIDFIIDEVVLIKMEEKKVKLANRELSYDILIIGLGFEAEAAASPALKDHIFPIANLNNARMLREHLEYNFAKYTDEAEKDPARLNIVIAGGGFTGTEYVGELVDRIPALSEEYDVEKMQVRVIMIECESSILSGHKAEFVNYAMNSLESRGVEFITGATIVETKEDAVVYEKDGKQTELPTKTIVWAGGERGNSIIADSGIPTVDGKVDVTSELHIPENETIYVVGDCARITDPKTGVCYPANAEIAIASAERAADNIKAQLNGAPLTPFNYQKTSTIASLGGSDGVAVSQNGRSHFGWKAIVMKKICLNRYLMQLGGINLLMKKGRFNIFNV